jgi:hypothetical protein
VPSVTATEHQPKHDGCDSHTSRQRSVKHNKVRIACNRSQRHRASRAYTAYKQPDCLYNDLHGFGRAIVGILECRDVGEDLSSRNEEIQRCLNPDVDIAGATAPALIVTRGGCVYERLDDGGVQHGECYKRKANGDTSHWCQVDTAAVEKRVQELLDDGPKDNTSNLVHSRKDIVGCAVGFHLSCYEVVLHLVEANVEHDECETSQTISWKWPLILKYGLQDATSLDALLQLAHKLSTPRHRLPAVLKLVAGVCMSHLEAISAGAEKDLERFGKHVLPLWNLDCQKLTIRNVS